jgi:hypothetical protein
VRRGGAAWEVGMAETVASRDVYETMVQAMLAEARSHLRRMEILSNQELVEGTLIGLEEQRRGEGIPWEEVLRRLERA